MLTYCRILTVSSALLLCAACVSHTAGGGTFKTSNQPPGGQNASGANSQESSSEQDEVFGLVRPTLQKKSRVPARLPVYLAAENEDYPLHAILEKAAETEYEIQLAFDENCNGANVCRYGTVSGTSAKPGETISGTPVSLHRGITGYYVSAVCEAYCSDSTITWIQDGHLYRVGIKAAVVEKLIRVANSAVDAEVAVTQ